MNLYLLCTIILLCAITKWLSWQSLKEGTLIPYGRTTNLYGWLVSFIFKGIYYLTVAIHIFKGNFKITVIMIWCVLVGNYFAKLLERKLYSQSVISLIDTIINEYPNAEASFILSMVTLPSWWVELMPAKWQKKYVCKLQNCKRQL